MQKPEHARLCCTTSAFLKIFRSLLTPWVLPSPQLLHALVGEADYGVTLRDPEVLPTKGTVHIVPRQHARTRAAPLWSLVQSLNYHHLNYLWCISCTFVRGPWEIVNQWTDFFP